MTERHEVPKKPEDSIAIVSELMMPHQVNNLGHVFGGEILSMVDRAAAVSAMRHAGDPCVTVSIDRVDFVEPIYTGELVTCTARVNFVGRTSMEVGVRVLAENLLSGEQRHTNTCILTFVAIDPNHRPCPVNPVDVIDALQKSNVAVTTMGRSLELDALACSYVGASVSWLLGRDK